jgi:TBC1 domain family member 30
VRRIAFNDRSNPDDDELGIQIVKDLHRTGCSTFSGQENDQDRALLKRVLLAFARYNKSVGYCQGFNIIAALILEIVDKKEEDAFMCMIYLIDHVLPEGYFTNSMHSLAIDMAVFRELLKTKLPKLFQHLNDLQFNSTATTFPLSKSKVFGSKSTSTVNSPLTTYEPPLTNVFTMQWFLTLFATCLPKTVLLRVWDSIYLEGSEILFRTSLAIWDKLSLPIMKANTADAFYSMMSVLSIKLFDQNTVDENNLIEKIYSYGAFPLIGLEELREKFTFNINPFQTSMDNNFLNGKSSKKRSNFFLEFFEIVCSYLKREFHRHDPPSYFQKKFW